MKETYLKDRQGVIDENYRIAKDGSYIRDTGTGKKIKGIYNNGVYKVITITINEKYYHSIKICHLQWLAWKGLIPKKHDIHHNKKNKNGKFDKLNDHIKYLRCWTKAKHLSFHFKGENNRLYGKHPSKETLKKLSEVTSGEKNSQAILTWEQVKEIKHLYFWKKYTHKELMEKFNVSKSCINHIINGHTWNPKYKTKEQLRENCQIIKTPIVRNL